MRQKERPGPVVIPYELDEVIIDFREEGDTGNPQPYILISRATGDVLKSQESGQPVLRSRVTG
jgi:hypothetical protein